jgi:hypothetical protein
VTPGPPVAGSVPTCSTFVTQSGGLSHGPLTCRINRWPQTKTASTMAAVPLGAERPTRKQGSAPRTVEHHLRLISFVIYSCLKWFDDLLGHR